MEYILFIALFVKHFYIDFIDQSIEEVRSKGIWGDPIGFFHSLKHGIATSLILIDFTNLQTALLIGYIEVLIHYVTDYLKMSKGCQDSENKLYWIHLGADQLVHYMTYLGIVYWIFQ